MTAEQWEQIKDALDGADAVAPERRGDYLRRACPDEAVRAAVAGMLADEPRLGDFLERPPLVRPDSDEEDLAGLRLGPYVVEREIGRGGMGIVYLARRADDAYQKRVAVKLVFPAFETAEALGRFARERRALARLDHPGVARIIDGGTSGAGLPWLAMDYVEGAPLDEWCDARRLGVGARLALFRDVCAAVGYAHQSLVVHRDLKPSNILVTAEGRVKLLDFGLARLLDAAGDAGPRLTRSALRFLTPEYASPEQLRGEEVTTAGDVYSLGVLLYHLLTGRRPHDLEGRSFAEMIRLVGETDPPKPSTALGGGREKLRRELEGDLDNIVLKALAREPHRRYASAAELSEDVRRYLDGEPVRARPASLAYRAGKFVGRHRAASALAAFVVVSLVAGAAFALYRARAAEAESARQRRLLYLAEMREAGRDLDEGDFAGLRAALARWEPRAGEEDWRGFEWFYLRREARRERLELKHGGEVADVKFSPGGESVVTACGDGRLRLWDARTGRELKSLRPGGAPPQSLAFSPDGATLLAAGADGAVRAWDAARWEERWGFNAGGAAPATVALSPDGRFIAAASGAALVTAEAATGRKLAEAAGATVYSLAVLSDGRTVVTGDTAGALTFRDLAGGRKLHSFVAHPGHFVFSVAVSPDGRRLATGGGDKTARLWDVRTRREIRSFTGHSNSVRAVAFSPDGTRLVTAGADRLVKLWDASTGRELREWRGHTGRVRAVAFAPDGLTVASAGDDGSVKIWPADGGNEGPDVLTGHTGRVIPLAFSPDGRSLASGSADGTVLVRDVATGRQVWSLRGGAQEVFALAFSPDGRHLVAGANGAPPPPELLRVWSAADGRAVRAVSGMFSPLAWSPAGRPLMAVGGGEGVSFLDVETGREELRLPTAQSLVTVCQFSPDGRRAVTLGLDGTGVVWDVASRAPAASFRGDPRGLTHLAWSRDGRRIFTEGATPSIEAWDAATGRRLFRLDRLPAQPTRRLHAASPDGRHLLVAGEDNSLMLLDAESGRQVARFAAHTATVSLATFSPDGRLVATATINGEIRLWDARRGREVGRWRASAAWLSALAFSPDGRRLAAGGTDDVVWLWEARTGRLLRTLTGHEGDIRHLLFSPDGARLLAASEGWYVVHDVATGRVTGRRPGPANLGAAFSAAYSPDGRALATGHNQHAALRDAATGLRRLTLKGHAREVWAVRFSPDGRTLATASWDGTARLWDARDGRELLTLTRGAPVTGVAFSPDGRLLATGDDDRRVTLWDTQTGREVRALTGHADAVRSVAFSPDGRRIASGGVDQTVRVWDVASGQELLTLRGHAGEVWAVAFSPDGRTLASGSWDQTVRLWRTGAGRGSDAR
jgi:eukaryotic-like serine/threonine-protein kinase